MEFLNQEQIEPEQFKDWEGKEFIDYQNKEMLEEDALEQKKSCNENSTNSNHLSKSDKNKSDISHAASEVSIDINSAEEESNVVECCRRKRKRCDLECDNFKYEGSGLTCIGILPGLGSNIDSSDDSDQSCSSGSEANENTKYDLLGRRLVYSCTKSSNKKR